MSRIKCVLVKINRCASILVSTNIRFASEHKIYIEFVVTKSYFFDNKQCTFCPVDKTGSKIEVGNRVYFVFPLPSPV